MIGPNRPGQNWWIPARNTSKHTPVLSSSRWERWRKRWRVEVNDRDFDVALHIVFADQAAHDLYQDAELHHRFIAENKAKWKKVRVFDSVVDQG